MKRELRRVKTRCTEMRVVEKRCQEVRSCEKSREAVRFRCISFRQTLFVDPIV